MSKTTIFHVTPIENLPSIKKEGLQPKIGPRSDLLGEPYPLVYFFKTLEDVESACMNWLGECFDDEEQVALLEVDCSGLLLLDSEAAYELTVETPVSPDNLKILSLDIFDETSVTKLRDKVHFASDIKGATSSEMTPEKQSKDNNLYAHQPPDL